MWMAYSEQTWPKAVDLQSAIQRLERELDALALDAALHGNRNPSPEISALEEKYLGALGKCQDYLNKRASVSELIVYLNSVDLEHYASCIETFL